MNTYQPYTYLIKFIPTGQLYYGVKASNGCNPDELLVKYFTSSKVVKKLIQEYGEESFNIISIKLHENKELAHKWEELYLVSVDAAKNPEYLNKTNGGWRLCCNGHTKETIIKMSKSHLGKRFSDEHKKHISEASLGKHKSKEHILHMIESRIGEKNPMYGKIGNDCHNYGRKHTEESKIKISESLMGENHHNWGKFGKDNPKSKKYIITFPDEHEEFIIGLPEFCENNNLSTGTMTQVVKGKRIHHKGFKCRFATEEEINTQMEKL